MLSIIFTDLNDNAFDINVTFLTAVVMLARLLACSAMGTHFADNETFTDIKDFIDIKLCC